MHELNSELIQNSDGSHTRHSWVSGSVEELGEVVQGWTGTETHIRKAVIKPIVVFDVVTTHRALDHKLVQQERDNPLKPTRFDKPRR